MEKNSACLEKKKKGEKKHSASKRGNLQGARGRLLTPLSEKRERSLKKSRGDFVVSFLWKGRGESLKGEEKGELFLRKELNIFFYEGRKRKGTATRN